MQRRRWVLSNTRNCEASVDTGHSNARYPPIADSQRRQPSVSLTRSASNFTPRLSFDTSPCSSQGRNAAGLGRAAIG
jgi:hypothetical protein